MLSLTRTTGAPFFLLLFHNVEIDWNITGFIIFLYKASKLGGNNKTVSEKSLTEFSWKFLIYTQYNIWHPKGSTIRTTCWRMFKKSGTKFWNRSHYLTMYQIFLIQEAFWSSDWVELDFLGFVTRICLNIKSHWTKKIEVFSQGTNSSRNLKFNSWNNCHILLLLKFQLSLRWWIIEQSLSLLLVWYLIYLARKSWHSSQLSLPDSSWPNNCVRSAFNRLYNSAFSSGIIMTIILFKLVSNSECLLQLLQRLTTCKIHHVNNIQLISPKRLQIL